MDARRSQFDLGRVDALRVHLAEGSNVVVLELPYSTEFGRDSRKFASGVRKYGNLVIFDPPCSLWWTRKKQILSSLSTADVYLLSRVKVSETCVQPFQRYRLRSANLVISRVDVGVRAWSCCHLENENKTCPRLFTHAISF